MNFIRLSLCLFALMVPAFGQNKADQNIATVRFTTWGEWNGKELYLKAPKTKDNQEGYVQVDLLDLGYTSDLPYSSSQPIVLSERVEKDGQEVFQPLLTIKVPGNVRQPLVMVYMDGEKDAKSIIFELHPSAFPYGSYQVVNLCNHALVARMDDKDLKLPVGTARHFKGTGEKQKNVWLRVSMEEEEEDAEPKVVYSSMMRNREDKRMFMFFHPSGDPAKPVGVRTLVDFKPAEAGQ